MSEVKMKKTKTRKPDGPAVVILSGKERGEDNHEAILAAVMAGRCNPHGLVLVLRGEGALGAWPALELSDRLREIKASGKRVVTVAECYLLVSDLLVWLEGTTRHMTESGYAHVKVPTYSRHRARRAAGGTGGGGLLLPDGEGWEDAEDERSRQQRLNNPKSQAFERILDRLNEYLPVAECQNRLVTREELVELGLITGEGLDRGLVDCFAAEPKDEIQGGGR